MAWHHRTTLLQHRSEVPINSPADDNEKQCANMDPQTLISILTWALVVVGGGLVSTLVWFALRIVQQLDRLESLLQEETHSLDSRVTRLEDWRQTVGMRPAAVQRGID